jgi:hypothetical protein
MGLIKLVVKPFEVWQSSCQRTEMSRSAREGLKRKAHSEERARTCSEKPDPDGLRSWNVCIGDTPKKHT